MSSVGSNFLSYYSSGHSSFEEDAPSPRNSSSTEKVKNIWQLDYYTLELLGEEIALTNPDRKRDVYPLSSCTLYTGNKTHRLDSYCEKTGESLESVLNKIQDIGFCNPKNPILHTYKVDWQTVGD